ncbi:MAG: hypothetical protein U0793_30850 [Gemmataceae bacterium]
MSPVHWGLASRDDHFLTLGVTSFIRMFHKKRSFIRAKRRSFSGFVDNLPNVLFLDVLFPIRHVHAVERTLTSIGVSHLSWFFRYSWATATAFCSSSDHFGGSAPNALRRGPLDAIGKLVAGSSGAAGQEGWSPQIKAAIAWLTPFLCAMTPLRRKGCQGSAHLFVLSERLQDNGKPGGAGGGTRMLQIFGGEEDAVRRASPAGLAPCR